MNRRNVPAVFLLLFLCLVLLPLLPAHAVPRLVVMPNGEYPISMAATKKGIYLQTGTTLQLLPVSENRVGSPEYIGQLPRGPVLIASWRDSLFSAELQDNKLQFSRLLLPKDIGHVSMEETGSIVDCGDALGLALGEYLTFLTDFVMVGKGQAALLLEDLEKNTRMVWTDFSTGALRMLPVQNGTDLAAAPDGTLYVLTGENEVLLVQPDTGASSLLFRLDAPASCLAAGDEPGEIYAADDAHVYRYTPSAGVEQLDDSPLDAILPGMPGCVAGTSYLLMGNYGLYLSDPEAEQQPYITVNGGTNTELKTLYEMEKGVTIQDLNMFVFSTDRLIQDMANQDGTIDLYVINTKWSYFPAVLDKGYYAPLEESNVLSSMMDGFDPRLAKFFQRDGHIGAFPLSGTAYTQCIPMEIMEILDLTPSDLPTTFEEYIPWLKEMAKRTAEYGIQLFPRAFSLRSAAFGTLLALYIDLCEWNGEPVDFESHRFRELLKLVDDTFHGNEPIALPQGNQEPPVAFLDWRSLNNPFSLRNMVAMPLALSKDDPVVYPAEYNVYVLNPYSTKKDLVLDFLSYAAQHTDDDTLLLLNKEPIDPVELPTYQEDHENSLEKLKSLEEELKSAPAENRRDIEQQIEECKDSIALLDEKRWVISQTEIETFHQLQGKIFSAGGAPIFSLAAKQISQLANEFYDEAISTDQFVTKLQELSRMITLEMK